MHNIIMHFTFNLKEFSLFAFFFVGKKPVRQLICANVEWKVVA